LVPANFTWSISAGDFTGGVGNSGTACEGLSLTTTTGASTTIDGTPTTSGFCATGGAGFFTVTVSEAASTVGIVDIGAGSDTQNLFIIVLGNFMYVADPATDSIKVIDWTTNTEVGSISVPGGNPHSVAVTKDGLKAYVTLEGPEDVAVIDTQTNTILTTIDLSDNPSGQVDACAAPRGVAIGRAGAADNMAYVACTDGDVQVIDTTTDTEVTTINDAVDVNNAAEQVAVTPAGDFVYVSSGDSASAGKIATATNTASQFTLPTPGGGSAPVANRGVIVSADGARVYFADQTNDDIIILNTATDTANANSPISFAQGNPERFTISEDGLRIFCTFSGATDQLVIVDDDATPTQATGSPVALTNNDDAVGVTIPPGTGRVYIALSGADVLARRNDTTPFASAGANIALSGATTPQGLAHIPIPQ
jgi:YVTN family beta-propeller protein